MKRQKLTSTTRPKFGCRWLLLFHLSTASFRYCPSKMNKQEEQTKNYHSLTLTVAVSSEDLITFKFSHNLTSPAIYSVYLKTKEGLYSYLRLIHFVLTSKALFLVYGSVEYEIIDESCLTTEIRRLLSDELIKCSWAGGKQTLERSAFPGRTEENHI